ncbi:MAG: hypothetical protein LBU38_02665 [Propionibacteriaceae bacterium]|jgi:xylulokinase|nr:hypothetical protein [Propionibacteriaceae bacterium]
MLYLSIDIGTSAAKASILNDQLSELATAQGEYPYILLPGSKVEMDPTALFDGIVRAVQGLPQDLRSQVECLAYDTFSPSPTFVDENGELTYPNIITHMDRRSKAQSEYVGEVIGNEEFLSITGLQPFTGGSGLMSILWLQANAPQILAKTASITHLAGYVHRRLTGVKATDLVNASMLGVYETTTQAGWSKKLISTLNLNPDWFGEIYNPGNILGALLPTVAGSFGLKSGIPVTVGTNDMAAAQVGAGNTKAGSVMNTAGSSDMISILTDVPVTSPDYYLRNSAIPGIWQIYATTAGGFAIDWFKDQFAKDLSAAQFYSEFIPAALAEYRQEKAVGFEPYLTGDRQSLAVKTGSWTGLTLAATRGQMLGALLTSMQQVLGAAITQAQNLLPLDPNVKITGGLATDVIIDIKKDQWPGFTFTKVDNCSILGNVRLAQLVGGII